MYYYIFAGDSSVDQGNVSKKGTSQRHCKASFVHRRVEGRIAFLASRGSLRVLGIDCLNCYLNLLVLSLQELFSCVDSVRSPSP